MRSQRQGGGDGRGRDRIATTRTTELLGLLHLLAAGVGEPGTHGAVLHYLKAVRAVGADEAKAVLAELKKLPLDDFTPRAAALALTGASSPTSSRSRSRPPTSPSPPFPPPPPR